MIISPFFILPPTPNLFLSVLARFFISLGLPENPFKIVTVFPARPLLLKCASRFCETKTGAEILCSSLEWAEDYQIEFYLNLQVS